MQENISKIETFETMDNRNNTEPNMPGEQSEEQRLHKMMNLSGEEEINNVKVFDEPLESYNDDFTPNLNIEWDNLDIETLLSKSDLEARWNFNIPSLLRKIEGVNAGHLIEVGARPNTGKTSFHASLIASPEGFARQGARCMILCNEEATHRVGSRYLTSATGMDMHEIKANPKLAHDKYEPVKKNIMMHDCTGKDMAWVESACKSYKPDVIVLDMGDKFARMAGYARPDEALKANAIYARQIAKQYDCVIFYMSQLSAEAEGRQVLNQAMMEGSRTGKAAEADLMILIGQPANVEGVDEQSNMRHLNVVKNKITGWHGMINCNINPHTARYSA